MHPELDILCSSLEQLAQAVAATAPAASSYAEQAGWNMPNVNSAELSQSAANLAAQLRLANPKQVAPLTSPRIQEMIARINYFRGTTLPNNGGGNTYFVVISYLAMMESFRQSLRPILEAPLSADAMPPALRRRFSVMERELTLLERDTARAKEIIDTITRASEKSDELGQLLNEVGEIELELDRDRQAYSRAFGQLTAAQEHAREAAEAINGLTEKIRNELNLAQSAHQAATSEGLSVAFSAREKTSRMSMRMWTLLLLVALSFTAWMGYQHYQELAASIGKGATSEVTAKTLLSLFSAGGGIWLAWIASLQITHNFKIAEDYALKAANARSFEAFRQAAAEMDKELAEQLFRQLLSRIGESPLRYVDQKSYGSPGHAVLDSDAVNKVLEAASKAGESLSKFVKPGSAKTD